METPMRTNPAITAAGLAGLAALACAGSVQAHHSHLLYQTTPIWISGTVTSFELKNPHAITTLEGRSENGQVLKWTVEGPSQTGLDRRSGGILTADGDYEIRRSDEYLPKVGDTLEVCAYPYRPAEEIARDSRLPDWRLDASVHQRLESSTTEGSSPRLILGHLLVTTGGALRVWEPFGSISECMRSSNVQRQSWIELLNANPEAHKFWCDQGGKAVQSNASSKGFVEETNVLLAEPCKQGVSP
jgi:hypothetical protein